MSEPTPIYKINTALLDRLLAVLEDWQWARLLFHLANIINGTGWGEVKISLKEGKMIEISSTMTEKPRPPAL